MKEGTIFGAGINQFFFPCCLTLFFLFNLFNLYRWVMKKVGLSNYVFDSFESESRVKEGVAVVNTKRLQFAREGTYHRLSISGRVSKKKGRGGDDPES